MTDEPINTPPEPEKPAPSRRKPRGIVFIIVSACAVVLIPAVIACSILVMRLLSPGFYTGILENGRLVTAFVEARNWQIDRAINDEIEKRVGLSRFKSEFEAVKRRYEQAGSAYKKISREDEIEALKRERKESRNLEWSRVKQMFPNESEFERLRADQIQRIDALIERLEEYRDTHRDAIEAAEKEMKKSRDEYEDALSTLEDKNKEAKRIIEKHKNTLSSSIYDDLEIIEGPLTKIINVRLMEGPVRSGIEKMITFFTGYDDQVERGNVYYERVFEGEGLGRRSLRVKIPGIEVGLWVNDESGLTKHVLSQLLADEIDSMYNLRNRALLSAMFRYSDSSLGEYFGSTYLSDLGLSIRDGVIRMSPRVLKGASADYAAFAMQVLSWARYLYVAAAALVILYVLFVFFSAAERRLKLSAVKAILMYPSFLVLAACGILLWMSRYVFSYYPDLIENISIRSFARHMSFIAAWRLTVPLIAAFGALFIAGLVMRKLMLTREPGRENSKHEKPKEEHPDEITENA
jgi:hypothetical protein